ncbi:hydantoinase B/oxoprolinase family protein [Rhodococcus koreensis]|uniref:hydantoinase B/oxoprolinase family protein n=1 Tax=Rhodococcus koreensis TaxID=99653 RepID=UPI00366E6CA5
MSEDIRESVIDPVTFEVLRNALVAVVDEMGMMLEKVAFSTVVSEGRDFSTSLSDADGNLVADGTQDLPGHVGTIPFTTAGVIEHIGRDNIRQGDIIMMNDPFIGGTHCQDVRLVMPVFWNDELVGFVQASAHIVDAGGAVAGSFQVDAASPYEEALYIPPIHLVRGGELDERLLALILRNVRISDLTRGDITAMIESCKTGESRFHALCEKYGAETIRAEMSELLEHSREMIASRVESLPDGTYSATDFIDYDPLAEEQVPLPISVKMTVAGRSLTFDFSESSPQAKGAINATRSLLWSAVVIATKAVFPEVPINQGIFWAIDIEAPDGLVCTATFPAAVGGAFAVCCEKITAATLACFLQIIPERTMVASGNLCNCIIGGYDPRPDFERDYVLYNWNEGGLGARPGKRDNHTAMGLFCSGTRNQPVETMELEYPVIFTGYSLMSDSAGPGYHRGGLGVTRNFYLTHEGGTLSVLGDRERTPAWGSHKGQDAKMGNQLVYKADTPEEERLGMMRSRIPIEAGHLLKFWQGGGGGYGPAWQRPVEWVVEDVVDGRVSPESAREDYFVAISSVDEEAATVEVDLEETKRLRAAAESADAQSVAPTGADRDREGRGGPR